MIKPIDVNEYVHVDGRVSREAMMMATNRAISWANKNREDIVTIMKTLQDLLLKIHSPEEKEDLSWSIGRVDAKVATCINNIKQLVDRMDARDKEVTDWLDFLKKRIDDNKKSLSKKANKSTRTKKKPSA